MTAEGGRATGFGRLEDWLRQASPWYMGGPYVREHPYVLHLDGTTATIDHEPAESTTSLFGGSSNRRGPMRTLAEIADDLRDRLISIFTRSTADGRRPCFSWVDRLHHDPRWRDNIYFNEYYHGDNAAGLGASHQTGWTGLIADVIRRRPGAVRETVDVVGDLIDPLE